MGLGHSHPKVREALEKNASRLVHGMGDVHPSRLKVELLERIVGLSPIPLSRVILGQNGSDAVESALKTAMLASGKPGVIAFEGAYHGLSYGALETTARSFFREPFHKQLGHFAAHLPYGCQLAQIEEALVSANNIGAIIVEPIQGRGGIKIPPAGWLAEIRQLCHRLGTILIFDEIFTGWGRTGDLFACLYENVIPDILCVGKTMGGGMPISACIASEDLMKEAWGNGSAGEARHTYTFLGHPLSCAAACAALDALTNEKLVERSKTMGEYLVNRLHQVKARNIDKIKDVRGRGLMIGVEFQKNADVQGSVYECLQNGVIVLPAGNFGETIEIAPPFVIELSQCDYVVKTFETSLKPHM
jgi:4-aminobutyrate aminotransferase-like enzyme